MIIYDVNGFIGGMHSVVASQFTSPLFDFGSSKWYRADQILGVDVFLTTAYFVDPSIICGDGRSQADFDTEGTGNRLLFQNGAVTQHVQAAPLTLEAAEANVSSSLHSTNNIDVNLAFSIFQI